MHTYDKAFQEENSSWNQHEIYYASKENIQGIRNGFDLKMLDEFDEFIIFMQPFYMELAFFF